MPRFLSNLFSSCCWIESRSLGTKLHGAFHLFVTTGTEFWVDSPGSQDQGAPLDPSASIGLFGQLLDLAFLFRIEVAQRIREPSCVRTWLCPKLPHRPYGWGLFGAMEFPGSKTESFCRSSPGDCKRGPTFSLEQAAAKC